MSPPVVSVKWSGAPKHWATIVRRMAALNYSGVMGWSSVRCICAVFALPRWELAGHLSRSRMLPKERRYG